MWSADETIGWVYQYFTPKELRDQARKESAAPRNSYELAFRNQFFTPRYVVEFLTDNTLGRIWYEMRKGQTRLKDQCRYMVRRPNEVFLAEGESLPSPSGRGAGGEGEDLSQEDLLKQPAFVPHRPKKDPRELRILDPACGSGHFLLYCFDLLQTIYEEAWADPDLPLPLGEGRGEGFRSLRDDYSTLDALRRDVPRLILAHNLHGIDIDLRATQIAALALWLKCQKAYQDYETTYGLRTRDQGQRTIRRSNIVCAEPMPGEEQLLEDFLKTLRQDRLETLIQRVMPVPEGSRVRATQSMVDSLCELVRVVWEKMRLAGEAGSLLKIEEELQEAIRVGQEEWEEKQPLFRITEFGLTEQPKESHLRFVPGEGVSFWQQAESLVMAALHDFATFAGNGQRLQRRLFVDNAVHGFAFVDLSRRRFDVVVMNPPFGNPTAVSRDYLGKTYPRLWADLYAAFITRTADWLLPSGRLGAITSRTFLALSSFEPLRDLLLCRLHLMYAAECGLGVLDAATVRAAFFVAELTERERGSLLFIDLRNSPDRAQDLLSILQHEVGTRMFLVRARDFRGIPGKPFCYWLPRPFLDMLAGGPHLDRSRLLGDDEVASNAKVAVGASTTDDERFVRCHWEIDASLIGRSGWVRFAHATGFCRFYAPTYAVLKWYGDGHELLSIVDSRGNTKPRLRCAQHFFKPGLVSPYISELGLGCSFLSSEHVLSNSCRGYYDIAVDPSALVAYLNSSAVDMLTWALTPDRKHEAGIIAALPLPESVLHDSELARLGKEAWKLARRIRAHDEADPYYVGPTDLHENQLVGVFQQIGVVHERIDALVAKHFGMSAQDINRLLAIAGAPHHLGEWIDALDVCDDSADEDTQDADQAREDDPSSFRQFLGMRQIKDAVSHAIGCAYGRWDIRATTGVVAALLPSDPQFQIPVCAPAALLGDNALAVREKPTAYPLRIDWDGIMVDDAEHRNDIVHRVREVLEVIWTERAESVERKACDILGVRELRDYFRKPGVGGFWDDHVKRYSKSRRRAPLYWLLQSSRKNYALWLYYHRLDKDILFK
ncbi:MAG TPA: BREX-1 system adenine-specific DNA-methyltransferase PglX, partial [Armatimonadota bacterium]|nr:BREX-1 system adenine-specific DNA-methyltransferase PglX [Armatimonadota bacterium]